MCENCNSQLVWSGVGLANGTLYVSWWCRKCLILYVEEKRYAYDSRGMQLIAHC